MDQNEEHTSKEVQINASASTAPAAPAGNQCCETQGLPVKEGCGYTCPSQQDLCALSPIKTMRVVLLSYTMDNGWKWKEIQFQF